METANYFPILILFLCAFGFVAFTIIATHLLGPSRKTDEKLENFESGIEQKGNARQPFAIKYFLVAILFVLFDVEVIFFYPYAANFKELGWEGFYRSRDVRVFVFGHVHLRAQKRSVELGKIISLY